MEYDEVQLVNDFVTEERLQKSNQELKKEQINMQKLNEDINLLYVGVTRSRNLLHIPAPMLPSGCPASPQIIPLAVAEQETKSNQ